MCGSVVTRLEGRGCRFMGGRVLDTSVIHCIGVIFYYRGGGGVRSIILRGSSAEGVGSAIAGMGVRSQ